MSSDCIKLLDDFYRRHCNDEWEHFYGFTIETCDNPGWLLTLNDPSFHNILISSNHDPIIKKISDEYHIDITYKNEQDPKNHVISIFGPTLKSVLDSTARLITHIDK